jgi:hypothetical protein
MITRNTISQLEHQILNIVPLPIYTLVLASAFNAKRIFFYVKDEL